MTLKNAARLALIGMILLTILSAVACIVSVTGFLNGVVSAAFSALFRGSKFDYETAADPGG